MTASMAVPVRTRFEAATVGALSYDADGSGDIAAVTFAVLENKPAITYADVTIG